MGITMQRCWQAGGFNIMKTFVYTLNLKDDPEVILTYKEYHKAVWPEVQASLLGVGIIQMRIYLLGRRLVNIMDTNDEFEPDRDFARYTAGNSTVQKWDAMMAQFQEKVPEAREGEWWALMEQVFELD
jgi:L-rhamnose mutarotase